MKFLIAPNAFKGTISAQKAAELIQEAIRKESPEAEFFLQPIADGGDGTCELLLDSLALERILFPSLNAIGQPCMGFFGWDKATKTAYLDVSTCSGLGVLEEEQKDPWLASTFGTGLMVKNALQMGAKEVVLGLGGSATIDLGTGILAALGFEFLDERGSAIPVFSKNWMTHPKHIQLPIPKPQLKFTCLCDVQNYFFGSNGAIPVYGPQKGLKSLESENFEKAVRDFYQLLLKKAKVKKEDLPGFGAAGGIAMGLSLFFDVSIQYGANYFFEKVEIEEKIKWADWIITGEGKYDHQSAQGKGSFELLQLAKKYGKRTALITSGHEAQYAGFDLVLNLPDLDFRIEEVKKQAEINLFDRVELAVVNGEFD